MPALIAPSPITAIALPGAPDNLLAMAKPSPAEIEVEECAAPNGSYSLSLRLVKPDNPPAWRKVRMRSRRPVKIDRESTRLNSSHVKISYAVFCLKKKI